MKKFIKLLVCSLLIGTMCLSFCSCDELDDLKKEQGFYSEDLSKITLEGETYVAAPEFVYAYFCNDSNVLYQDEYYSGIQEYYYITKEDVPVLLSSIMGSYYTLYHDNSILYDCETFYDGDFVWMLSQDTLPSKYSSEKEYYDEQVDLEYQHYNYTDSCHCYQSYYFKEDKYDEILANLNNFVGEYNQDKTEIYHNNYVYKSVPIEIIKNHQNNTGYIYGEDYFNSIESDYNGNYISVGTNNHIDSYYKYKDETILIYENWVISENSTDNPNMYMYKEAEDSYYCCCYYFREDVYDKYLKNLRGN